ncbi:MAG: CDGSH iron-sulfur domain-containing protein [Bacteroidota bacterium]
MEPGIVEYAPKPVALEAGKTYVWCPCGASDNQPFCDGSHKGSEFVPNVFTAEQSSTVYLCMCKHTANPGLCDGSHSKL